MGDITLSNPELITLACEAALEKKAEELTTLPLEGRMVIADYFLIATGRSKIHTRSIADGIAERVREAGFPVAHREGYADGGWILLDLHSVIVHVFTPEQRAFYNLERLWGSPEQRLQQAAPA